MVETKLDYIEDQIDLLWKHNRKRADEIDAIRGLINSAIYALAVAALGMVYAYLIKPKFGL